MRHGVSPAAGRTPAGRALLARIVAAAAVLGLIWALLLLALGFGAAALYLALRGWTSPPLAALLTSVSAVLAAKIVVMLVQRGKVRRRRAQPERQTPWRSYDLIGDLIRLYPQPLLAAAFALGFLLACSAVLRRAVAGLVRASLAPLLEHLLMRSVSPVSRSPPER